MLEAVPGKRVRWLFFGKRSAQRPEGAEATGIAAEIGAQRRLERKARPRSGSPRVPERIGGQALISGGTADVATALIRRSASTWR